VIAMASKLKMMVIAEGVETKETNGISQVIGCHEMRISIQ